jgi:hypothetical protein
MPPFIVRPKEKSEDPNDYFERNSTPRRSELTVLNLDVNPLKTETISIKGHENHSAQNSHHSHDLTYQNFCKTHVSHGNIVLSSIDETNSKGLDAFNTNLNEGLDMITVVLGYWSLTVLLGQSLLLVFVWQKRRSSGKSYNFY